MGKLALKDIVSVCNPDWLIIGEQTFSMRDIGILDDWLALDVKEITGWDDGLTVELFEGSSPCEHFPVGIYKRAKSAIKKVYEYSAVGSGLHIVLDDENIEDSHIQWCLENSIPDIENEKERSICEKCADLLLKLPMPYREELVHSYGREWW